MLTWSVSTAQQIKSTCLSVYLCNEHTLNVSLYSSTLVNIKGWDKDNVNKYITSDQYPNLFTSSRHYFDLRNPILTFFSPWTTACFMHFAAWHLHTSESSLQQGSPGLYTRAKTTLKIHFSLLKHAFLNSTCVVLLTELLIQAVSVL